MLQIKLINVYGSHSQLTLLASLINNSCYSQTAVQFIISKKNLWLLLIMIRDDWEIESLQWEYLRVKSLQKNHCWIDFLQNALLQKSLLQIETSFRKNPCRKKITAYSSPAKWQSFKNISCNNSLLQAKITAELYSCRKNYWKMTFSSGKDNFFWHENWYIVEATAMPVGCIKKNVTATACTFAASKGINEILYSRKWTGIDPEVN